MKKVLLLCLFLSAAASAQIDTSDYYPMHIGDMWEYTGYRSSEYDAFIEITGDTTLPDGNLYYIFEGFDDYKKYRRVDDDGFVVIYNHYGGGQVLNFYNLLAEDKEFWNKNDNSLMGVLKSGLDNNNIVKQNLKWKHYVDVFIDSSKNPTDTIWGWADLPETIITQGLGITSTVPGWNELTGAKINGVVYGNLTNVENITEPAGFELAQNYPNPFNPSTAINYSLDAESRVILKVYDALGREVKTLVDDVRGQGRHKEIFNAEGLAAGIYIVRLTAGTQTRSIKTLLLK